jgi:hypothetical protein
MLKRATIVCALAFGCAGLAVVMTASSTAAEQRAEAFTIRSSLDGKTVLPHRIRWIAYPSAPVLFPGVEFLIDEKVVASNRLPPFAFGDDGRDEATGEVNTGYLVTSWLAPGKHRFTIRAKGTGTNRRTTATRTVVARVPAAPARPTQLLATWQRDLATAVPPDRSMLYRPTAPAGTYRFAINSRFIQISGPDPRKHVKIDYVAGPDTITIRGPVWTGDPDEGGWCEPWGPLATYSWTVSDGRLTLTPSGRPDACKQRGAVLTGAWARVK